MAARPWKFESSLGHHFNRNNTVIAPHFKQSVFSLLQSLVGHPNKTAQVIPRLKLKVKKRNITWFSKNRNKNFGRVIWPPKLYQIVSPDNRIEISPLSQSALHLALQRQSVSTPFPSGIWPLSRRVRSHI